MRCASSGGDFPSIAGANTSEITSQNGDIFIGTDNSYKLTLFTKRNDKHLVANVDGNTELYFNNSKKLETTSTGVDVTGDLDVEGDFKTSTARGYTLDIQEGINGNASTVTLEFVTGSMGRSCFIETFVGSSSEHLHHVAFRFQNQSVSVLTNDGNGPTVSWSVSGAGNSNITYQLTVSFTGSVVDPYARFRVSLGGNILTPISSPSITFAS